MLIGIIVLRRWHGAVLLIPNEIQIFDHRQRYDPYSFSFLESILANE